MRRLLKTAAIVAGGIALMGAKPTWDCECGGDLGPATVKEIEAARGRGEALMKEGSAAWRKGALGVAAKAWATAGGVFEIEGNIARAVDARVAAAGALQAMGRYVEAGGVLEGALLLDAKRGDVHREMAGALTCLRKLEEAEAHLVTAGNLAEENSVDAALLRNAWGNLRVAQGRFEDAIGEYRAVAELAVRNGDGALSARARANGAVAAVAGVKASMDGGGERQTPNAKHQTPNLALAAQAKDLNFLALKEGRLLADDHARAVLMLTVGQTDEALAEANPVWKDELRLRAFNVYREALRSAEAVGDAWAVAYAAGYLGHLYEADGKLDDALAMTRRAIFSASSQGAADSLYRWQWQLGRLLRAKGDRPGALRAYRAAAAAVDPYRVSMSMGLGNRPRGETFRQGVGRLYFDLADLMLGEADAIADAHAARVQLLAARDAVEQLKVAEIVDYYRDQCFRPRVRGIDRVGDRTAVVYFIPLPDRTEILVSTQGGVHRVKVDVGEEKLYAKAREFRREIDDPLTNRERLAAGELYKWLIGPIEKILSDESVDTLVFVPDGALRSIPMGALHDGKGWLIERYAVAVTPGLRLMEPSPIKRGSVQVLLNGLSEPKEAGFEPLPFVKSEVDAIGRMYPSHQLMNEAFVIPTVRRELDPGKNRPYSIVHIASHGQFSSDPGKTFVLTHDGRLTLNDLEALIRPREMNFGEPLELLTLSACETAAGDDRAALGLAGVAIKAGARSALATLWSVNDEAAQEVITDFYRRLRDEAGISKAKALQAAQKKLLAKEGYGDPYYWSPFLMIGNWL